MPPIERYSSKVGCLEKQRGSCQSRKVELYLHGADPDLDMHFRGKKKEHLIIAILMTLMLTFYNGVGVAWVATRQLPSSNSAFVIKLSHIRSSLPTYILC